MLLAQSLERGNASPQVTATETATRYGFIAVWFAGRKRLGRNGGNPAPLHSSKDRELEQKCPAVRAQFRARYQNTKHENQ